MYKRGAAVIPQVVWPRHCVADTPGAEFHTQLVVEASMSLKYEPSSGP